VGIHWLQAASVGLLGDPRDTALWPYRLVSVLGAVAAVALLYGFARRELGVRAGLIAAVALAGSLALVAEAHQAKTDAVLLAAVLATQIALARAYLAWRRPGADPPAWPTVVTFWAGLGAAFLLKGPVGPGVVALTAATLAIAHRDARWLLALRPLPGLMVTLAIVLPWSAAVSLGPDGGFYREAALEDWLPRLLSARESHGAPPGYYALTGLVTLWPASVLLAPAVAAAWRERTDPLVAFSLAWVAPAWVLLELVPTKLPHYTLPLLPALALLIARFADRAGAWRPGRLTLAFLALWLLATGAVGAGLLVLPAFLGLGVPGWAAGAALAFVGASAVAAWQGVRGRPVAALQAGALGALAFAPWLASVYLPSLTPAWTSQAVARAVTPLRRYPGEPMAVVGYTEPSIVFLLGTRTRLVGPEDAARHVSPGGSGHVAVVSEDRRGPFEAELARLGSAGRKVASVSGFHYNRGRWVTLHVYRRGP
jgi:4-amino-4-deoxy-L-arabinose transferase-like glycosyltransferase